jgi:hypothetical protein
VRQNKADYAMIAAVVETASGNYFPKLVGPRKTVARWRDQMMAFLKETFADSK